MTTALDKPAPDKPLKLTKGRRRKGVVPLTVHSDEAQMRAATGTADPDLAARLLTQVGCAIPGAAECDMAAISATVAALAGIEPRDALEGMLAVQMVAVHNLALEMARRAVLPGQTTEGVDINVSRATRLMRTFTAQVEALQRYRSAGQQTVTVQHVHVADGGQAVIGSVSTGGGGGDG